MKPAKWLYRLESRSPDNGLWYDSHGNYVWGCRHCAGDAKNLPMGFDERYRVNGKNWVSSCSNRDDLLHWFSLDDANYLIDRNELMKQCSCRKNCEECDFFTDGDSWCNGKLYGTTVMQMPTIDAVPVVRCKDCKYYIEDGLYPMGVCKKMSHHTKWDNKMNDYVVLTENDFFCADGVQKEKEK